MSAKYDMVMINVDEQALMKNFFEKKLYKKEHNLTFEDCRNVLEQFIMPTLHAIAYWLNALDQLDFS